MASYIERINHGGRTAWKCMNCSEVFLNVPMKPVGHICPQNHRRTPIPGDTPIPHLTPGSNLTPEAMITPHPNSAMPIPPGSTPRSRFSDGHFARVPQPHVPLFSFPQPRPQFRHPQSNFAQFSVIHMLIILC